MGRRSFRQHATILAALERSLNGAFRQERLNSVHHVSDGLAAGRRVGIAAEVAGSQRAFASGLIVSSERHR